MVKTYLNLRRLKTTSACWGDRGKNTGGMGAYSPSRLITPNLKEKIIDKIINPTLLALKNLNSVYKGFLYAGLMIKDNEPI